MDEVFIFQPTTADDVLKARLFSKSRLAENGCWEWTGPRDGAGYGIFYDRLKGRRAHRVSFELYKGRIPAGKVICHSCDNPRCWNPGHLRAATQKDNMADRDARGRRDVKGEQIGTSKLTADQVIAIKRSSESLAVLSERYGVAKSHIWLIRTGKAWKHLNNAAVQAEEIG